MAQWYCYIGGQRYGPVSEDQLRQWLVESRLLPTDHVWTEGMPDWKLACEVPGLLPPAAPTPPPMPPQSYWPTPPAGWPSPYGGPWVPQAPDGAGQAPAERVYVRATRAHRARLVVSLGIVGLLTFMFLIFGILAWNVGSGDLREMAEGRMDRSGQSATRAGMIMGIVGVVLGVLTTLASIVAGLSTQGSGFNRFMR